MDSAFTDTHEAVTELAQLFMCSFLLEFEKTRMKREYDGLAKVFLDKEPDAIRVAFSKYGSAIRAHYCILHLLSGFFSMKDANGKVMTSAESEGDRVKRFRRICLVAGHLSSLEDRKFIFGDHKTDNSVCLRMRICNILVPATKASGTLIPGVDVSYLGACVCRTGVNTMLKETARRISHAAEFADQLGGLLPYTTCEADPFLAKHGVDLAFLQEHANTKTLPFTTFFDYAEDLAPRVGIWHAIPASDILFSIMNNAWRRVMVAMVHIPRPGTGKVDPALLEKLCFLDPEEGTQDPLKKVAFCFYCGFDEDELVDSLVKSNLEQEDCTIKTCGGCYLAHYCGVGCQSDHRKEHRSMCKRETARLELEKAKAETEVCGKALRDAIARQKELQAAFEKM